MLPVLILGGIYGVLDLNVIGIDFAIRFTVTEAAAVSVVYALVVELVINRELKPKDLPGVVTESAVMMGSLFLILVIANQPQPLPGRSSRCRRWPRSGCWRGSTARSPS